MRLQLHGKGFREQCTIIHVVHLVVGNVPFLGLVQTLISSRQEMQNLEEKKNTTCAVDETHGQQTFHNTIRESDELRLVDKIV
jgi:hypothetical protein